MNCIFVGEAIKRGEENNFVTFSFAAHHIYSFITAIKSVRSKPQCGAECCVTFMMIMVGAGEDATDIDSGGIQNSARLKTTT